MFFPRIFLHCLLYTLYSREFMAFSQKIIWLIFLFFSWYFFGVYFQDIKNEWGNRYTTIFWTNTYTWGDYVPFKSKKIEEAEQMLQMKYYHFSEKKKEDIENGFIKALVESMGDKHSSYFPPKIATEFKEGLRGDFEGIGAVIDQHPKGIKIKKILKNSPAEKGWLKDGDILTMVDTIKLVWMKTDEAVDKIRGPKGSKITVKFLRWEVNLENSTVLVRDTVLVPSVESRMLSGSIGYIGLAYFGEHSVSEFTKAFDSLIASWAKWIIFDFRDNPGGFLDSAVDILSEVLPLNSKAVITRENEPKKDEVIYTRWVVSPNTQIPIVMLVNEFSASASEIVAGALQDSWRAILVGEKTYGKWSVQTPFALSDWSMMKLTVGRWYTPKDRWIDGEGIMPDISISFRDEDYKKHYDRQLEGAKKIMDTLLNTSGSIEKTINQMKIITF